MGLSFNGYDKSSSAIGKRYNVEYELGNERIQTFSNVLENADGKYFWFCSEQDGMAVIRQDRVITMVCVEIKSKHILNITKKG